ncbi:hypothetical protein [Rummeliibacillus pycnus]|uniref:hypothetical protein n=1 Tax=Rummeliibacillus pycnus TaxID=101070 RepID=UPI000C9BAD4A|nr:hypothetical protein [Rummeliibacillus pycnus]
MTKTIAEQIQGHIEKAYEIKKQTVKLAAEVRDEVGSTIMDIVKDPLLSPEGRKVKQAEIMGGYERDLYTEIARIKGEYLAEAKAVRDLANKTLLEPNAKPTDTTKVAFFEKEYERLKVDAMLGLNAEKSMKAIAEFVSKYDHPYFAERLQSEFSTLAGAVLANGNDAETRQKLSKMLEAIEVKATSPAKESAKYGLKYFENAEGVRLFPEYSHEFKAIESVMTSKYIKHINEPEVYFEAEAETQESAQ